MANQTMAGSGGKREAILLAAIEKFFEKDYYMVTVTEIAETAGVGKGTVYEYFASKEELYRHCFAYCADYYLELFRQESFSSGSVRERMRQIVRRHLTLLSEHKKRIQVLYHERPLGFGELQSWVIKRRKVLIEQIAELVKGGQDSGEIKKSVDPELVARLFLALNTVVVGGMVVLDQSDISAEKADLLLDILWDGIS